MQEVYNCLGVPGWSEYNPFRNRLSPCVVSCKCLQVKPVALCHEVVTLYVVTLRHRVVDDLGNTQLINKRRRIGRGSRDPVPLRACATRIRFAMATETVEEWVAIVWPEVKQLCHSVNPTEVLEELAALGWKRASESGDPELPDPFEELRTLVTKDLPAKSSCKLNTFRKALGDLRTKFVSDSTSPAHRGSYRTGSNDDVESDSYSFQGPVSETKTDLSADFRYIQLSVSYRIVTH